MNAAGGAVVFSREPIITVMPSRSRTRATMPVIPSTAAITATTTASTGLTPTPLNLLLLLIGFRLLNALTIRTFFQPDEYFQSLEPAWQSAFGPNAGAWLTWEWRSQLRSSIHPAIFAAVYRFTDFLATAAGILPGAFRSELYVAAPKALQAIIAALGDFSTWQLARKVYGTQSPASTAALVLTIVSPWQWFCSARTLSNCLETTLTTIALSLWPWPRFFSSHHAGTHKSSLVPRAVAAGSYRNGNIFRLRGALLLAAVACILRPTNVLIWLCVALATVIRASRTDSLVLIRESLVCGSSVLILSGVSDRLYYGVWTLPPLRFVHFNIAQSLAVFYGRNRTDYYLTEGLPLLLTTALPFAVVGLYRALWPLPSRPTAPSPSSKRSDEVPAQEIVSAESQPHTKPVLSTLAYTVLTVTIAMSCIRHKEVRFLYPLLPALHVLAAQPFAAFSRPSPISPSLSLPRKVTLLCLLALNVALAIYTTQFHQRGVIDVMHFLRGREEARLGAEETQPLSVAFLMPCHSTPWRSHLVYNAIDAWALTCEPPIDVPLAERDAYVDEADIFYSDPRAWVEREFPLRFAPGYELEEGDKRPACVVMFANLVDAGEDSDEKEVWALLAERGYAEVWRGWNSHWHDDWRRVGDVVVWCWADVLGAVDV